MLLPIHRGHRIGYRLLLASALLALIVIDSAMAQTTAFTYQGKLNDNGNPASGQYDFQFKLFDTAAAGTGTQQGSTIDVPNVSVTAGIFTVQLDFGAGVFPGTNRFLEISLRPAGGGAFTMLAPRQAVTSTPYALHSTTAGAAETATNATQLGGFPASGFIQNTTSLQAATSFNIGGTGTANILNAATQFNLGGNRILSNAGGENLFAGVSAGASNTTGIHNTFFGASAGTSNTTGLANSFFGSSSGQANTGGSSNSFFGVQAGFANTTGGNNSFVGASAGVANTTGNSNSFYGSGAGFSNTTGNSNSFFGASAGRLNTTGNDNSLFGREAGRLGTTGANNSFFGAFAGQQNTTGNDNSFFGKNAGNQNTTGFQNTIIGAAAGLFNTGGSSNLFLGHSAGFENTTGNNNSFVGATAGQQNTTGLNNSFVGLGAGSANTTGNNNTIIGSYAKLGANNLNFATAIGSQAQVNAGDTIVIGKIAGTYDGVTRPADTVQIPGAGAIGGSLGIGTSAPVAKLQVNTTALDQHVYLSSAAPSLALGNSDTRSTANMNAIFALSTAAGHFGVEAGGLTIANYGNARGNIYLDSNYSGTGLTNVILQPSGGSVGIGTTTPDPNTKLHVDAGNGEGVHVTSTSIFSSGLHATGGAIAVLGESTNGTGVKGVSPNFGVQGISVDGTGVFGLSVNGLAGYFQGKVQIDSFLSLGGLGSGGNTSLCRNSSTLLISFCSSSLRYKTGIQPFSAGLGIIKRLRPISFTWKGGGMRDVGFAAEEVETVEPLLTFRNNKGEVEGVKYDRITVALVNATREQQAQIEEQQQQMKQQQATLNQQQVQFERQQRQIDALKRLVCADRTDADVCKAN